MPDRDEFTSFNVGNFGDLTSEDLIDAGENFLNADPDNIIPVKEKKVKDTEDDQDDDTDLDSKSKTKTKDKAKKEEVVAPVKKEVKDDHIFSILENKEKEEDEEEENDDPVPTPKVKKDTTNKGGQVTDKEEVIKEEDDPGVFTTIAKELITLGVFSQDEDEEGNPIDPVIESPEDFAERFQLESKRQAADVIDRFLDKFGPEYRDMFQNVFVNGVPPKEYLSRFSKIEGIEDIDINEEANQERVVRQLLRDEGRSPEYIDKRINQLKNYNDLAEEATEAKRLLVEKEKKGIQQAAEQKQQELLSKQRIRNEYLQGVSRILQDKLKSKEFDGIPVNQDFVSQTFSYLTDEKWQTPDKQLLTDFDKDILDLNHPQNHQLKVKLAMLMQILKTDPQLTKLAKKAVSKESNGLFQGLRKQNKSATKTTNKEDTQNTSDWD